jgi:hypothetical protein
MDSAPQPGGGQGSSPAHSAPSSPVSSILVADCGTVYTKVSLLGLVEGQYRLMARKEAPTTIASPYQDVTKGIIQAVSAIEFVTGRRFIADGRLITPEQPDGDGVDVLVVAASAGGPMRMLVLGAVNAEREQLVAQAVAGLYAEPHSMPSPSFQATSAPMPEPVAVGAAAGGVSSAWTPDRVAREWQRQVETLHEIQPEVALIVGMAEPPAGPAPLQEACQLLINAAQENARRGLEEEGCAVIYAGSAQYVEAVKGMLRDVVEVKRAEPLTSPADLAPVSMAAGEIYEKDILPRIPGYKRLREWSATSPVVTANSISSLVRFLAQHYAMNVTAVDIGASTTILMQASENGDFIPMVNSGAGVGSSIGYILQRVGLQRIERWLPFTITEDELRQYVVNRSLHAQVLPTTVRDLQIGYAFAREALILTVEAANERGFGWIHPDLILGTGGILAHAPKYGQAALVLLDALQPQGVTSLVLDRSMLIPQLGAVATIAPVAAVQVNENDAVTMRLGTCVVPYGDIQPGEIAIRVGVEYTSGRQVSIDVRGGSIEVIPLRPNEQAMLSLFPSPTVDVGLGPGERAKAAEEIDGGLVGLIIDARGRPLGLPENAKERQARLLQWMQAMGV